MSSVSFRCPSCHKSFAASNTPGNLSAICPSCNRVMRWFYAQNNQRYGPLLFGQLVQLAQNGILRPEDWVHQEGSQKWIAAAEVPGLMVPKPMPQHTLVPGDSPTLTNRKLPPPPPRPAPPKKEEPARTPAALALVGELWAVPRAMATVPLPRGPEGKPRSRADMVRAGVGYTLTAVTLVALVLFIWLGNTGTSGDGPAAPNPIQAANQNPQNQNKPADPLPGVQVAQNPDLRARMSAQDVYKKILPSTAWILTYNSAGLNMGSGSGCLIDAEKKLVITNAHVVVMNNFGVLENAPLTVYFPMYRDGKVVAEKGYYTRLQAGSPTGNIRGKIIHKDMTRDLALIELDRLPAGTQAVMLAKESAFPGEPVHAIGNPGASGGLWVYTSGSVRSVYHKSWQSGPQGGPTLFNLSAQVVETTVPANPGDSGGPLLNEYGELAGVTQGYSAGANLLSYAIDISEVHSLLNTYKKDFLAGGPPQK